MCRAIKESDERYEDGAEGLGIALLAAGFSVWICSR